MESMAASGNSRIQLAGLNPGNVEKAFLLNEKGRLKKNRRPKLSKCNEPVEGLTYLDFREPLKNFF